MSVERERTEAGETRAMSTGRFITRIGLELLTVFVGVTLAFLFDNYRQRSDEHEHQRILQQAVVADVAAFEKGLTHHLISVREGLARFDSLRAAGKRPVPFFLRVGGAERPPTDVWQAVMQSGAGELFDADLMVKLSNFYNETSGEATRYQRYTTFTEQRIFPILESDTSAFYDSRTGDLKPEFKAHIRQLREIASDFEGQAAAAHELSRELAGRLK
jgi:hypothetical protein